jgi:uncharacterized protein YndB with AHSA1/START domain
VEPERFADWFGGAGCDIPLSTVAMDVRKGGSLRLTMFCGPERREIRWRGSYHEVVAPERLVFTISDGPGEDFELVTVVLTEVAGGRTEMLLQQRGRMSPAAYERAGQGWSGFFDRMAQRLAAG